MVSFRKAIDAKCKECCYDPLSGLGTWRAQVETCPCTLCPLYKVRPKTQPKRAHSQALAPKSKALSDRGLING